MPGRSRSIRPYRNIDPESVRELKCLINTVALARCLDMPPGINRFNGFVQHQPSR
jgi:hypothetical protein